MRVASGPEDPRFQQEKFMTAPAIFPTNDIKYDANKTRARWFAAQRSAVITYAAAKDTPSEETLREKPGIAAERVKWLQRRPRERKPLRHAAAHSPDARSLDRPH